MATATWASVDATAHCSSAASSQIALSGGCTSGQASKAGQAAQRDGVRDGLEMNLEMNLGMNLGMVCGMVSKAQGHEGKRRSKGARREQGRATGQAFRRGYNVHASSGTSSSSKQLARTARASLVRPASAAPAAKYTAAEGGSCFAMVISHGQGWSAHRRRGRPTADTAPQPRPHAETRARIES